MKKIAAASLAVFLVLVILVAPLRQASAFALTKIFSAWIQNSQIDSTSVGASTPSTGAFTTLSASSTSVLNGGTLNSTYAGNPTFSGNTTFNNSITGSISGNAGGNAATASALQSAPAPCANGTGTFGYSTGIDVHGNAVCVQAKKYSTGNMTSTTCPTAGSTYDTCTATVTLASTMDDTNFNASCTGLIPSDPRAAILSYVPATATTITVTIVAEGSNPVSYGDISCTAIHK